MFCFYENREIKIIKVNIKFLPFLRYQNITTIKKVNNALVRKNAYIINVFEMLSEIMFCIKNNIREIITVTKDDNNPIININNVLNLDITVIIL